MSGKATKDNELSPTLEKCKTGHHTENAYSNSMPYDEWVIDSGATQHYAKSKASFETLEPLSDHLLVGNGNKVEIKGIGTVAFTMQIGNGEETTVRLKEVYYVPSLISNLVSTVKLDRDAGLFTETGSGVMTFKKDGHKVMTATLRENYYVLDGYVTKLPTHEVELAADVWHARLGCLSGESIERLQHGNMVEGFKVEGKLIKNCENCTLGKATRTSFKESMNPRVKHPLDLIHMDLVVINIASRQDERVALVIIDDHSECKFAFPLRERTGTAIRDVFLDWLGWAERITDRKLKSVHSDNAKEFKFGAFALMLKELHVEHQLSIPYEHEQNGKAERAIRTLLDKSRCMLLRSGLQKSFWADALVTAAFVSNQSPVRGIKETPIERFTDVKPNLSKLRVFGSWAWAHVLVEKTRGRHKLDARAVKCRFLYYTQGGHAYMLMDEGGNTFEAVSVRFDETLVTQSNGGESEIRPESLDLTDLNDEEEEEEREIAQADVPESDGEDAFEDAGEYKEQEPSDTEEGKEEEELAPLRRATRDWKPTKVLGGKPTETTS